MLLPHNGDTCITFCYISSETISGQNACHQYERMRREAACVKIQKYSRMCLARKAYVKLCSSAISIQTGLRVMAAHNELRLLEQTKAAIVIQVKLESLSIKEETRIDISSLSFYVLLFHLFLLLFLVRKINDDIKASTYWSFHHVLYGLSLLHLSIYRVNVDNTWLGFVT